MGARGRRIFRIIEDLLLFFDMLFGADEFYLRELNFGHQFDDFSIEAAG